MDTIESGSCAICKTSENKQITCDQCSCNCCKSCIEEWFQTSKKNSCPQCRKLESFLGVIYYIYNPSTNTGPLGYVYLSREQRRMFTLAANDYVSGLE
jgi:hypothetical protein